MKLTLVDDWRSAWRWASVRTPALGIACMSAAEVLGSGWAGLPPDLRAHIPHAQTIALVLFGVSMVGRLLKQKGSGDAER